MHTLEILRVGGSCFKVGNPCAPHALNRSLLNTHPTIFFFFVFYPYTWSPQYRVFCQSIPQTGTWPIPGSDWHQWSSQWWSHDFCSDPHVTSWTPQPQALPIHDITCMLAWIFLKSTFLATTGFQLAMFSQHAAYQQKTYDKFWIDLKLPDKQFASDCSAVDGIWPGGI